MAEDQSLQSAHSLPAEEGKDLGSSSNKSDNTGLITSQSGDPSAARNTSHNFPTSVEALLADDAASAHAGSGTQTDTLDAIASTSMTWQQQNRVGWRKYGKKLLAQGGKASPFKDQEAVAMYYKCGHPGCNAREVVMIPGNMDTLQLVFRGLEEPGEVVVKASGTHTHKLVDGQGTSQEVSFRGTRKQKRRFKPFNSPQQASAEFAGSSTGQRDSNQKQSPLPPPLSIADILGRYCTNKADSSQQQQLLPPPPPPQLMSPPQLPISIADILGGARANVDSRDAFLFMPVPSSRH